MELKNENLQDLSISQRMLLPGLPIRPWSTRWFNWWFAGLVWPAMFGC